LPFRNFPPPPRGVCGNNCCDSYESGYAPPATNDLFYSQLVDPITHVIDFAPSKVKDCHCQYRPTPVSRYSTMDAGSEGWGDDLSHEYVIEDMLKLSPAQILFLKKTKPRKVEVFAWLTKNGMGPEWFDNYGDTWCDSVEGVLEERGVMDLEEVLEEGGVIVAREEIE